MRRTTETTVLEIGPLSLRWGLFLVPFSLRVSCYGMRPLELCLSFDHVMILECEGYVSLDHVYVVFYSLCRVQQHLLVVGRQSLWLTREEQSSHPSFLLAFGNPNDRLPCTMDDNTSVFLPTQP